MFRSSLLEELLTSTRSFLVRKSSYFRMSLDNRLEQEAIRRAIATIENLVLLEGDNENSDDVEEEE